jgi:hypothetical protein
MRPFFLHLHPLLLFMQQFFRDGARIEAAFRKYFHRAEPTQVEDSREVIVCHANVIRYFVCRYVLKCFNVKMFHALVFVIGLFRFSQMLG